MDLTRLSLAEVSAAIGARRVSPVEATEACLREIAARDGTLHSFITLTAEAALATAREREAELAAGRRRGPLHGVPLAVKDLFLTAGTRTTAGSRVLAGWVPDTDAWVVCQLHRAGAVLLGKLNMHEFAFGPTGENPHWGTARNPRDPERIAGGSSSGSASAVGAGLCYGALGSDTGGSIRCPAALCGIVGLKPTYGRVSRAGVLPLAWSLDHVGPMTRTVTDAALMLEAIAGHDPADATSARRPVPVFSRGLEEGVEGLRLGVPREFFWKPIHPGVERAVWDAIDALEAQGARVSEVSLPIADEAWAPQSLIIHAEAAAYHRPFLRERAAEYGRTVRQRFLLGTLVSAADYLDAQRARRLVRGEVLRCLDPLQGVDALLTPAVPIPAPPIGAATVRAGDVEAPPPAFLVRNTGLFNLTGLPAISVPCGTADGLPVGLQIAGRPWDEATVLRVARAVERLREGATP